MKLIIQIPCYDEEQLPATLADLPREVDGVDEVEWLIIDDGSTDRTVEVARENGVDHIVKLTNNKGLAAGFQAGLDACLKLGADVIVNTDADNQYYGGDIPKLVAPILAGDADMVVGDRQVENIEHFSSLKVTLQHLGSAVVRRASGTEIARHDVRLPRLQPRGRDPAPGRLEFTYTLESIIQAGKMLVATTHVPVGTNAADARVAAVPVDVGLRPPQRDRDLPDLRALRAAARVPHGGRDPRGSPGRHLGPLLYFYIEGRGRRSRPVADPRRGAVHRRGPARRARRDGRHPRRHARRCSSARSNASGASSCGSASSRRTTSRAQPSGPGAPTTGRDAGGATGKTDEREALKL